jgi:putative membrane protein
MQKGFAFAAVTALLIAAPTVSFAQSAPRTSTSPSAGASQAAPSADSKSFLTDAAQGDAAEIKMGQLAEKNGGSAEMKQFGKTLVTDHTKAGDQVKATAKKVGVTVAGEPNSEQKKDYDKLSKLKGADFDKEFARMSVEDHQKDIAKFQKEANAKDGPVSDLAHQQLPVLQKHLQMAQSLQSKQQASAPK